MACLWGAITWTQRCTTCAQFVQEEREELKVLAALTATVASHASNIHASLDAATQLDLACARAKHAACAALHMPPRPLL